MLQLILFLSLFVIGYFVGNYLEKRHYVSIKRREQNFLPLIVTGSKKPLGNIGDVNRTELVRGNAVISVDYFKRILAALRAFFGGNVSVYETLLDRSRREAILRLKESCPGATQIINLRIETSSVFKGKKDQVGSVEVLAYATAIYTT